MIKQLMFKSVEEEIPYTELNVKGRIPSWLEGALVRNGPAKFELGPDSLKHWFDGFAMLHKFNIKDGKVFYKSKFLGSEDYEKNIKQGRIKTRHFGTVMDPCENIFGKFFSSFKRPNPNNANVAVLKVKDRIVATSDFSAMVEFDFDTLETIGKLDHKDKLGNGYMISAAHHAVDIEKGEYYNCVGEVGPIGRFHFYKFTDNDLRRNYVGYVKAPKSTYFHSFALTKKYFIFIEQPVQLNLFKLMFGRLLNIPYEGSYKWKPEKGTKFHLLNRETGEIKKYTSEAFFFFHTINAFDDENSVTIDLCLYDTPDIVKELYFDSLMTKGIPYEDMAKVKRIIIDLISGKVEIKTMSEERLDLPNINLHYGSKEYKYVYGFGYKKDSELNFNNQLVKIDIKSGITSYWFDPKQVPSEPIFVASPNRQSEDDGIVLTIVLDGEKRKSFLLMLDGKTFKEIARAEAPLMIPIGLHGIFYKEKSKNSV